MIKLFLIKPLTIFQKYQCTYQENNLLGSFYQTHDYLGWMFDKIQIQYKFDKTIVELKKQIIYI